MLSMTSPDQDPAAQRPTAQRADLDATLPAEPALAGESAIDAAGAEPVEDAEPADDVREQEAILRRVPRIEVFLALGAVAGLLLALVLTFLPPLGTPDPETQLNPKQFTTTQVFGFFALALIPIGLGIGGLIGSLLGRDRGERVRLVKGADAPRGERG